MTRSQNLLLLHFIVVIFGFTGILGKEISIDSTPLVFWRMLIGFTGMMLYVLLFMRRDRLNRQVYHKSLFVGIIIAVHWITFFEAIKQSNVSVTLATMASTALFVSLFKPLLERTRLVGYEVFLGVCTIFGLILIFGFATEHIWGIVLALISSALAALFTIINAQLVQRGSATLISTAEMASGMLVVLVFIALTGEASSILDVSGMDWVWLLLLGLVATAFAFVASVVVMKQLSPFTVALTVNLEPVYTIILALAFYREEEFMDTGFYIGASVIVATIFVNSYLKERSKKKLTDILDQ